VSEGGQGVDESKDGFLIALGERGDALEAFPQAAGIGIVVDAPDRHYHMTHPPDG